MDSDTSVTDTDVCDCVGELVTSDELVGLCVEPSDVDIVDEEECG